MYLLSIHTFGHIWTVFDLAIVNINYGKNLLGKNLLEKEVA